MNKRHEAALKVKPIYAKGAQSVDDSEALKVKGIYSTWEECLEIGVVEYDKPGFKFTYNGELYKCNNANPEFQATWIPGTVPALYVRIDETHAGTIDDPITAARGMEYTYFLHYIDPEDGLTYLCQFGETQTTGTVVLQHLPHELVGQYFKLVTE